MSPDKPLAMFGGPLEGSAYVRYVFIDEAGIAATETISVVCGVIVHADTQCKPVESRLAEILKDVPDSFKRKHPIFSAKTVWGERDFREEWGLSARKRLLEQVMSIPRELKLAISMGAERRDSPVPEEVLQVMSAAHAQHGIAFQSCVAKADFWIRQFAGADEAATVIAEDVPENKKLLRALARSLTTKGYELQPDQFKTHRIGVNLPVPEEGVYKVSRIRMPIYFAVKEDEPLLQIADACAFGFRRFMSEYSHGSDFIRAIIGSPQDITKWKVGPGGSSYVGYWSHPGPRVNIAYTLPAPGRPRPS